MKTDGQHVIEIKDLVKTYTMGEVQVHALQGVSFTIDRGEMISIMGPSGSGKSTLMNILGCLDTPTSGLYKLDGVEVSRFKEKDLAAIRNKMIGFVFQSFNLLSRTDAVTNVELPLVYAGAGNRRAKAMKALERVGLAPRAGHKPNELSGGEQQRVAIARAMVNEPSMILADEPTGNLDTRSSREIMSVFQELNRQGITVVLITHESDIASYTRRTVFLRDGQIVSDKSCDQVIIGSERDRQAETSRAAAGGPEWARPASRKDGE